VGVSAGVAIATTASKVAAVASSTSDDVYYKLKVKRAAHGIRGVAQAARRRAPRAALARSSGQPGHGTASFPSVSGGSTAGCSQEGHSRFGRPAFSPI
jgi:hypothetical protein